MNLRELLRNDFSQYIRNRIIKRECEFCGGDDELHLHHIDRFHNLLVETLDELKIQEFDTEEYDEFELEMIRNLMIAKQIKCEYKTLCKLCHMKLHAKEKYSEEYKKHYYNPCGSYSFINVDKLFHLKGLNPNMLVRALYLSTWCNYDGLIVSPPNIKTRRSRGVDKGCLQDILGISRGETFNTISELSKLKIIYEREDGCILINKKYITKGYNNFKTKLKIFNNDFYNFYKAISPRQHKAIGRIILGIDRYIYNTNDFIEISSLSNKSRFKEDLSRYKEIGLINYNDKTLMINPKLFWLGSLDNQFKEFINKYNNLDDENKDNIIHYKNIEVKSSDYEEVLEILNNYNIDFH